MKTITLAHSDLTKTIYAIIGKEKIDITNQAIAEVKAIKALEQQPSEDCVSRTQALKELKESAEHHANDSREEVLLRRDRDIIRALPPVTPAHGTCKDCKWWRDSDGEYRRGVRAESKCPINAKTVYLGDGYCYKFEPRVESEE